MEGKVCPLLVNGKCQATPSMIIAEPTAMISSDGMKKACGIVAFACTTCYFYMNEGEVMVSHTAWSDLSRPPKPIVHA